METDLKLNHRPNWLLNYVYTPATVVKKDNKFTAKDQFYFQATVHVDESLAPLKGTLNWRLYDVDENKIACYNIPVELTLFWDQEEKWTKWATVVVVISMHAAIDNLVIVRQLNGFFPHPKSVLFN